MKIVKFTAQDFKALTAVEIEPGNAPVVQITGRNAQGKTSVLDAIATLIEGGAVAAGSIHAGAERSVIQADLGDLVVQKTLRPSEGGKITAKLTVEAANGARYKSPQAVLDSFFGALTFDPLAFMKADAKTQFNMLRRFVPDLDFDAIDQKNALDYEARTSVNREVSRLRAAAASERGPVGFIPDDLPSERVDESALLTAMGNAAQTNAEIEKEQLRRSRSEELRQEFIRSAGRFRSDAADLRKEADRLDADAAYNEAKAVAMAAEIEAMTPLQPPVDVSTVREAIDQARTTNALIDRREKVQRLLEEAAEKEWEADGYTDAIEKRNADKLSAIAAAKMPVPGLGFGDGVVLYNEHPLYLASGAEALVVSVAIAMALNPKLRVILIRDGNSLDSSMWNALRKLATDHDFQVWVESVDETRGVGFVIEAGTVVSSPSQRDLLTEGAF